MDNRVYRIDNLKVVCVIMVVVAHTLIHSYGNPAVESIRFLCLCYTMPMFFFMSGMLSKVKPFGQTFQRSFRHLLLPCIVFSIVYNTLQRHIIPGFHARYDIPGFAMWYLWVLFLYRLALPCLSRIPHAIPISFVAALCVPLVPWVGARFALCRIICFLPYFLLGYAFRDAKCHPLTNRQMTVGGGILLLAFALWIAFIVKCPGHTYRTAFNSGFGGNPIYGLLLQGALIGTICITGAIVWVMMPDKPLWFTKYGSRTMAVYLLHGLFVLPSAYCVFRPFSEESPLGRCLMIVLPATICLILFNKRLSQTMARLF